MKMLLIAVWVGAMAEKNCDVDIFWRISKKSIKNGKLHKSRTSSPRIIAVLCNEMANEYDTLLF